MYYRNKDKFDQPQYHMKLLPPEPIKVFLSYAHEDQAFRDILGRHLASLVRNRFVTQWYDGNIRPGIEWAEEIYKHLNRADIILLLVSPNFMASDFCYHVEMTRALQRHHSEDVRVIPIILRPTYWQQTPIGELQALPRGGKAISTWRNRDQAYLYIVQGIHDEIRLLLSQRWLEKSGIFLDTGRYDQALTACDAAIAHNPANISAYMSKGALLWQHKQYVEALHIYDQVILLDPKNTEAHMRRASALLTLGRHEEAVIACEHVISLEPENALAYLIKASIFELLRDQAYKMAKQISGGRWQGYLESKDSIIDSNLLYVPQTVDNDLSDS